jgi:glycerol-3-phosphate dehydrogenase
LQNDDRRVVFMIPYLDKYTLIGTTDIPVNGIPEVPQAGADEIRYLCAAVNRYLEKPISPDAVLWSYAGVRPLYDDGSANPSAVTRDYTLRVDADHGAAPVLSVFGGKITTYRKLAEHVLEKLKPWFPDMKGGWTDQEPLPGSDLPSHNQSSKPWRALPQSVLDALAGRHGARINHVLQGIESAADLGTHFGHNLYAREIDYMLEHEWAHTAEDVLYRRSKIGPFMTPDQKNAVAHYIATRKAAN